MRPRAASARARSSAGSWPRSGSAASWRSATPRRCSAAAAVDAGRRGALVERPVFRRAAAGLPRERRDHGMGVDRGNTTPARSRSGACSGRSARSSTRPGCAAPSARSSPRIRAPGITINRVAHRREEAPRSRRGSRRSAPADAISYVASGDLAGGLQRLLLLRGAAATTTLDQLLAGRDHALAAPRRGWSASRRSSSARGSGRRRVTLLARVSDGRAAQGTAACARGPAGAARGRRGGRTLRRRATSAVRRACSAAAAARRSPTASTATCS